MTLVLTSGPGAAQRIETLVTVAYTFEYTDLVGSALALELTKAESSAGLQESNRVQARSRMHSVSVCEY